jgi:GNAT superfamily N-acetyltransferase
MSFKLRPPTPADVDVVAKIIFDAFVSIADKHNFPRDFVPEGAAGLAEAWINHPRVWGVLAERDGRVIGCNFLDQRNVVPGVGPICIDPAAQGSGVGRRLMQAVIERGREIGASSIRLVQDAFNTASMSLYTSLGFDPIEPLALMRGAVAGDVATSATVRPMTQADLTECADLCRQVHGFDRAAELNDALKRFRPFVLVREERIRAYASAPTFWIMNHAVAEREQDLCELLGGASRQIDQPLSLLVPIRSASLFRWCLARGLRVVKPMTLMAMGDYQPPRGAWYPSVEY